MNKKVMKQMAKMVDAVQPNCDEEIVAAMTCSHAGSMGSLLTSKLMSGVGVVGKSSNLPNPVFIAVGAKTIYAFDYAPGDLSSRSRRRLHVGRRRKLLWHLSFLEEWQPLY